NARSLAFPMDMAITRDGKTLYVVAFGSSKIGVFDTESLENDNFEPSLDNQIAVSGGGPSGIVLNAANDRLYVLTRFNNSISVIDTSEKKELANVSMYNPEPESVVNGRPFLYDATFTSSHGDSACASCHVFGDFDSLAWDLGDPDFSEIENPGPFSLLPAEAGFPLSVHFRPVKGPMTTQSLRGLANHGPMHWRGDRTGGNDAPNEQPDSGAFDEEAALMQFQETFVDVNGRDSFIPEEDMRALTRFLLQNHYPPNPIRNLDNTLTPEQAAGADLFFNGPRFDLTNRCGECHVVDPDANPDSDIPGFFGTQGFNAFIFEPQMFK